MDSSHKSCREKIVVDVLRCLFKGIIPSTVSQEVRELFIPQNEVELKHQEALSLPVVNITKVRMKLIRRDKGKKAMERKVREREEKKEINREKRTTKNRE